MEDRESGRAERDGQDSGRERSDEADRKRYEDELREKYGPDLSILEEASRGERPRAGEGSRDPLAEEWAKLFAEALGSGDNRREPDPRRDQEDALLAERLRGFAAGAEVGYAEGFELGKSRGFLKGARQGYVEGYGEAFDLVMEARNPGRAATVESRKAELEEALGFRTDGLDRGARGSGGSRK